MAERDSTAETALTETSAGGKWMLGTARAAGGSRHFKLWVPGTVERLLETDRPWPLVVLLHGCTHDASDMAEISGMNEVAEVNRFLVVY
ncbi:MAG: PHB depolymerase family esterase, partial [Terriglobales bacterium]